MINPKRRYEADCPLVFKSCHSLGGGKFLVAGGMYSLSNSPSSHRCAMAAYDSISREWIWTTNLPGKRIIDFSCISGDVAVGGITSATRRVSSGIICIDVTNGRPFDQVISVPALTCIGSLDSDRWIAGTWVDDSKLHFFSRKSMSMATISQDPHYRIRGLIGVGHSRFISTMQRTQDSSIMFVHQLRDSENRIHWEYESAGESVIKCGTDFLAIYSDASIGRNSQVEIVNIPNGKIVQKFRIYKPLASLIHLFQDYCVYCSDSYHAVFAAEFGRNPIAQFAFPNRVDGWLSFSVDRESRTVFACKGNNFQEPSSRISVLDF